MVIMAEGKQVDTVKNKANKKPVIVRLIQSKREMRMPFLPRGAGPQRAWFAMQKALPPSPEAQLMPYLICVCC